jgi:hypothetical protein
MTTAMTTNSQGTSATAWSMSSVPVSSNATTYLQGQPVGNSAQLSQLAMIETSDSISPDCLTAIGQYRQARNDNATAQASLEADQLDGSDSTNSEVQQLNLLNAAQTQQIHEMQSQGILHACLASQLTVTNMQQRNAAAQDLNTWGYVKQQQAANPTFAGGGSDTNNFLP